MRLRFLFILLFTGVFSAFSQNKGAVSGTVTDKVLNNETLPFANVLLLGTNFGTTTDENGKYTISADPGNYTIQFSFLGYETIEEPIVIVAGETITLNKQLGTGSYTLQDVVVQAVGNRERESALLLDQKNAVQIKTSIGAQEMSRKGVSNVEGGVTKISGVSKVADRGIFIRGLDDRYNYLQINGLNFVPSDPNLKTIPLSFIPTDVVRNIDVYKTFNASLYQDFAGASINILTKDIGSKPFTKISLTAGMNTNTTMKDFKSSGNDAGNFFGYTGNSRDLPAVFDENQAASYQSTPAESKDLFKSSWTPDRFVAPLNTALSITNANSFSLDDQRKIGYIFNFNFSNNYLAQEGQRRNLNSAGTAFKDFEGERWKYQTQKSALASINLKKFDKYNFFFNAIYIQNSENSIEEIQGENTDFITIDKPFFLRDMKYIENTSVGLQQYGTLYFKNKLHTLDYGVAATIGKNDMPDRKILIAEGVGTDANYVTFNGADPFRYYSVLDNVNTNGKLSYQVQFGKDMDGKRQHAVTVGTNFDYTKYDFFNRTIRVNGGANLTDTSMDTDNPQQFFDANFDAGNLFYTSNADPTYKNEISQITTAGYVNYVFNTEKMTVDLGARVEQQLRETKYRLESSTVLSPFLTTEYAPFDFSPVVNLRYEVSDKSNMRFTASKTSTKPRVREILPFRYQDGDGNFTFGNPDLKNTQNYNVDLKYEYFATPSSLMSVALFGKVIKDPITRLLTGTSTGFLTRYDNFEEATLYGIELESSFGLDLLFGESVIAKKTSFGINTIYMQSDEKADAARFPRLTSSSRSLQGASDFILNTDLSYEIASNEKAESQISVIYNTFSERIYAVGTDGAADIKQQPIHQLDLTWRNTFSKKYQLNLTVRNLLDSEFLLTQDPTSPIENPARFSNVSDRVTQGVNVSLEFAYTF